MLRRRHNNLRKISRVEVSILLRRIRLVSGLILFTFLTTHLMNHALGLISLATMEVGRTWFLSLWRNPLGTLAL
jgi:adenylate cyclase